MNNLDVHVMSFTFIGFIICTYLSFSNYYLAQKTDPGFIPTNRDQQYRVKKNIFLKLIKNFEMVLFKEYYSIN